jgi:hypothetical protein
MPGSGRLLFSRDKKYGPWHRQPFSYVKACRAIETLVFMATMVTVGFSNLGSKYSDLAIMACIMVEILIVMLLLERVLWKLLPLRVRDRVPYDVEEALKQKGDVRSYRDLPKLWTAKRTPMTR